MSKTWHYLASFTAVIASASLLPDAEIWAIAANATIEFRNPLGTWFLHDCGTVNDQSFLSTARAGEHDF